MTKDGVMMFSATLKQYFSYIVTVGSVGGGILSTRRKPPTCHMSKDGVKQYIIITYPFYELFTYATENTILHILKEITYRSKL